MPLVAKSTSLSLKKVVTETLIRDGEFGEKWLENVYTGKYYHFWSDIEAIFD